VWEKKTNDATVHDKDNTYSWSSTSPWDKENGTAFSTFLDALNSGGGFGGANGWRLPTLVELQTIVLDFPCTAVSCTCPSDPCVDPALDASTTQSNEYWSATKSVQQDQFAYWVHFSGGWVSTNSQHIEYYVRAVRGGL
jgi:hypothetical protein